MNISIIVTHRLFTGAGQDLYKYLKNKGMPVLLVEHSFASYPDRKTTFSIFDGKKEIKKNGINYKFLPDLACYIKDFTYSLSTAVRFPFRYHIYFGCGGFNVISGLILKLFRRVDKVVFYTIDFMPNRFHNRFLNRLYLLIDKICVIFADRTWNLSSRMSEGREKYNNMPQDMLKRQRVVPIGIWHDELQEQRKKIINEKILVFCGGLSETHGIQLVLEAMPEIIKRIPDFKFLIIGDGNYKPMLLERIRDLNIEKNVEFSRPVYDSKKLQEKLCAARIGVAPYKGDNLSNVYFADVTKPKTYLSCGLPLIITKVPSIHKLVAENRLGIVINYNKDELIDAVVKLMADDNLYLTCKRNAEKFITNLDWNNIFNVALRELEDAGSKVTL